MEIAKKGGSAELGGLRQAMVTLKWTTAADFDLAALYEKKDGTKGFIFYGNLGDLNVFPFMKLSGDEGVGDTGGDNEEVMRIAKLDDDIAKIHIIAWDYGMVEASKPARFAESDVKVSLMDDQGTNHAVTLDTSDIGNVTIIATIDNTSPMGAKLINESAVGMLKGLNDTQQLWDIINR